MKKVFKILLIILLVILLVIGGYGLYLYLDYYRVEDNLVLEVENKKEDIMTINKDYKIMTYNIGFAAYSYDFSFFMDGGDYSRAYDKDEVLKNMNVFIDRIKGENPDIFLIEEVDKDGTRSHHVDEYKMLQDSFKDYTSVFAQNFDSSYLMYPIFKPHGANLSGIATFSKYNISSSLRRQLPVEKGVYKILDLDRCYSISRMPLDNGRELVIFTLHLSAYTRTPEIASNQVKMLLEEMQEEYDKGNYVIAGGDFNKDLLGDSSKYTNIKPPEDYTWNKPIDMKQFEDKNLTLVKSVPDDSKILSCRNSDKPMMDNTYTVLLDGFIVSDNIEVKESHVIDTGFDSSDHNPIEMSFKLKEVK